MRPNSCWLGILSLLLPACAAEPVLPPLDAREPASPQAREAPLPPVRRAFGPLDDDDSSPSPTHHHAYVCPMHADVGSDEPGRCVRCKMALVKWEERR